jgi:hypothetical protein
VSWIFFRLKMISPVDHILKISRQAVDFQHSQTWLEMQKLPSVRRLRVQDARIRSFVSLARLFHRLRFLLSTEEQGRFLSHVRHLLFSPRHIYFIQIILF